MSIKYTIAIHDDVRIVMTRITRDEVGSGIRIEADYLPRGVDSRDDPATLTTLTSVHQKTYTDSATTVQDLPQAVAQALGVVSTYIKNGILAVEFPPE